MDTAKDKGAVLGAVYGDIIGAPYMIENTYNRYFELGESRRAYSHGRVRTFFPEVTEVAHATAAVIGWLIRERESPTSEGFQKALKEEFAAHPRGDGRRPHDSSCRTTARASRPRPTGLPSRGSPP